jgi:hypothetical protein
MGLAERIEKKETRGLPGFPFISLNALLEGELGDLPQQAEFLQAGLRVMFLSHRGFLLKKVDVKMGECCPYPLKFFQGVRRFRN